MKWDLTYLFKTYDEFSASLNELDAYVDKLASYNKKLKNEKDFMAYLLLSSELEEKLSRVFQYAHLKSDLNKKDVNAANDLQKVFFFLNKLSQATSFESPEILAIGEKTIMSFIDNNKEIEQYRFAMEKLFHMNKHVLDSKKEELLSYFNSTSSAGSDLYDSLATSDRKNKTITLSTKEKVTVTQGNWRGLICDSKNKNDRKKVFRAIFDYYEENKNTFAKIYQLEYQLDLANMKARKYKSILEAHLFNNNIPTSVYTNLVDVASNNNESLKKYIKLRKKYLGLSEHYSYDRFLQLAHSDKKYSYDEAKELFFASIESCPNDFKEKAKEVLRDGFVDVYESDGKRSGAYSSSQANLHPYILLNYSNTLDDVFTVAHESGHSIHSMYAMESQPAQLQGYTIFVAEIASTFNEHMLLDYLMNNKELSKDEKIMLLQKEIDEIMSTFYRQTLFAQYELEVSKLVEQDEPINHEVLSNIMIKLYKQYYGMNIKKEKVKQFVWAYIPHLFHTPFYVYQYATSFAASFALYENVKQKKKDAFTKYTNLLKSGGSKYPIIQTKEAGIDLTKKETFMAVVHRMDELVNQLEKLLGE
ncbi:MAG: oligoendopeptidase F [Candidatus Caccosoma sp.]|nr:oligoendopeptidase F [Candidatus Caccosoma sp.]